MSSTKTKTVSINDVIAKITTKLLLVVPDNTSLTPIALSYEREENGEYIWAAYIEIECPWTTFDIRATSKYNAQNALVRAYTKFAQELARA